MNEQELRAHDSAEAAKLQTYLMEHYRDQRPGYPDGLMAWALNALKHERGPATASSASELNPEVVFWQALVGHSPFPAEQWDWPVRFSIEYVVVPSGADRIRITSDKEGNRYALYHAVCSILNKAPGDDALKNTNHGFLIHRGVRDFLNFMPASVRPAPGGLHEFDFTYNKE